MLKAVKGEDTWKHIYILISEIRIQIIHLKHLFKGSGGLNVREVSLRAGWRRLKPQRRFLQWCCSVPGDQTFILLGYFQVWMCNCANVVRASLQKRGFLSGKHPWIKGCKTKDPSVAVQRKPCICKRGNFEFLFFFLNAWVFLCWLRCSDILLLRLWKSYTKTFCGSREICTRSNKLPQVTSIASLVETRDSRLHYPLIA